MSDELQNVEIDGGTEVETPAEAGTAPEQLEIPTEAPKEGSELATDTGDNQEGKTGEGGTEGDEKVVAQGAINKQHKKFRDEERAHQDTQRQLQQAQQQLAQAQGTGEPVVPEVPDSYDENFVALTQARDAALIARATWNGQQQQFAQAQQNAQFQAQNDADKVVSDKADVFAGNAKTLGVDAAKLQEAAGVIAEYGIPDAAVMMMLDDADGPLMTQYLASNLAALDALRGMSPHQMVLHLNGEIREKAASFKPRTSDAPNPPETLSGGGADEHDQGLKGVTYE